MKKKVKKKIFEGNLQVLQFIFFIFFLFFKGLAFLGNFTSECNKKKGHFFFFFFVFSLLAVKFQLLLCNIVTNPIYVLKKERKRKIRQAKFL
jgi:hypothetical protein